MRTYTNLTPFMGRALIVCACLIVTPLLLFGSSLHFSIQDSLDSKRVTGTITNEIGDPMPGVMVHVENNKSIITSTDVAGNYELDIPENAEQLVFSYAGFSSQFIDIKDRSVANLSLVKTVILEETVAIGYGIVKKSGVTGAIASLDGERLNTFPMQSRSYGLQGRFAGLDIQLKKRTPGISARFRMRGTNTINARGEPMTVADGFPGSAAVNINDLQSVQILKDASATSIYGANGANGVILLTTKRGQPGRTKVSYNPSVSFLNIRKKIDLLNADQFVDYIKEADSDYESPGKQTDWQDEILRNGLLQNHHLSVSGGNESFRFYLSGLYVDQKGLVKETDFNRYSVVSNFDVQINKKLTIGSNIYTHRIRENEVLIQSNDDLDEIGVTSAALKMEPDQSIYDDKGEYNFSFDPSRNFDNPIAIQTLRPISKVIDELQGKFFTNYSFNDQLSWRTNLGGIIRNRRVAEAVSPLLNYGSVDEGNGDVGGEKETTILFESYLTFNKTILEKHDLTLMSGYSHRRFREEEWKAKGRFFIGNEISPWGLNVTADVGDSSSSLDVSEIAAWYGRFNYAFDKKYILTFNGRYEGSSTLGGGLSKWGFFPSLGAAWNMHEEKIFANINNINLLKLRASYGTTGSRSLNPYETFSSNASVLTIIDNDDVVAFAPSAAENNKLKWETTTQLDIGVDLGLFDNRFQFSFDYYHMDTDDLIFTVRPTLYSGFHTQIQNNGVIQNKGFEITLSSSNNIGRVNWYSNLVFSKNKNTILNLPDGQNIFYNTAPEHFRNIDNTHILSQGQPLGSFYGYIDDGVDPNTGDLILRDLDENGEIDEDDRTIIGDPNPDFIWGFDNTFTWKNFDFNLFFQGTQGNDLVSFTLMELDLMAGKNNATTLALDRWTENNRNTNVPRVDKNRKEILSSRWVMDGSYVRLKNISLGYTFPPPLLKKWNMQKFRIYLSAQNLLTITEYKGYDPEVNFNAKVSERERENRNIGLDYGNYPNFKGYTFGLEIGF